jgi:multidrug efflux pump subunit AcrA (membrane-fusion protein)
MLIPFGAPVYGFINSSSSFKYSAAVTLILLMRTLKKFIYSKYAIIGSIIVILGGGGYLWKKTHTAAAEVQYLTGQVEKGTLTVSVSGSGQVSSSNSIDIKPDATGKVTSVNVKKGQTVTAGQILATVDSRDALAAVRDAQVSLESAQLALQKLTDPADNLDLMQAQNDLNQAIQARQDAVNNIAKSYEDGFNAVSDAFLTLPGMIDGLDDALHGYDISASESTATAGQNNGDVLVSSTAGNSVRTQMETFQTKAEAAYGAAEDAYNDARTKYQAASRTSDHPTIEDLVNRTLAAVRAMSDAAKAESDLYDTWVDYRSSRSLEVFEQAKTYQSTLDSDLSKINGLIASFTSALNAIAASGPNVSKADLAVAQKTSDLEDLKNGPDEIDVKTQQLSVQQKQNALLKAQQTLADYSIRAPFDGVLTDWTLSVGDSASTTAGTLATTQKVADIDLNEVDVANVKVGQKATLTFDAVDDLSLTGTVAEVADTATTSQGVVSYAVKIAFDSQDDRIKAGMSVSVAIITDVKQDVLLVPNSAVKTAGDSSYVQTLQNGQPVNLDVQVGASNDTETEITGGSIKEGDSIITQIISPSKTTTAASTSRPGGAVTNFGGGAARTRFGGGNQVFIQR